MATIPDPNRRSSVNPYREPRSGGHVRATHAIRPRTYAVPYGGPGWAKRGSAPALFHPFRSVQNPKSTIYILFTHEKVEPHDGYTHTLQLPHRNEDACQLADAGKTRRH